MRARPRPAQPRPTLIRQVTETRHRPNGAQFVAYAPSIVRTTLSSPPRRLSARTLSTLSTPNLALPTRNR
ncbi:hypothetical protein Ahu01nite_072680 [Winogradskya humida]|uniref:Uncharacterized protein n=1 Tax=Winogradskya humida TaxID=113566 RepID=A0ABQ4A002_9ACTN|nr:hypothetical protein Ahu01nite_072680 [Actinoplanes humidus]